MTLRGEVVDDVASCASCLYVNRDFLLCAPPVESGEEGWKGCEEDIVVEERHGRRAPIPQGVFFSAISVSRRLRIFSDSLK